jgi:hypothetical protein
MLALALFAISQLACHGDDRQPPKTVEIYVAGDGRKNPETSTAFSSLLWKDGQPTKLSEGHAQGKPNEGNGEGRSVFLHGDDVYVAGTDGVDMRVSNYWSNGAAVLWKNGKQTYLSGPTDYMEANSVYVYGDDVYVAGTDWFGQYPDPPHQAVLWKNGDMEHLSVPDDTLSSRAESVFVSNGDVYVAGTVILLDGEGHAALWKNGELSMLYGEPLFYEGEYHVSDGGAHSVFVSEGDVYVAGYSNQFFYRDDPPTAQSSYHGMTTAVLWKNGEPTTLSTHVAFQHQTLQWAEAMSVFVSGDDVYVAGWQDKWLPEIAINHWTYALLWKNGEETILSPEPNVADIDSWGFQDEAANSVCVVGDDVYVAGTRPNNGRREATLWVNGKRQSLPSDYLWSAGHSVVVKELK